MSRRARGIATPLASRGATTLEKPNASNRYKHGHAFNAREKKVRSLETRTDKTSSPKPVLPQRGRNTLEDPEDPKRSEEAYENSHWTINRRVQTDQQWHKTHVTCYHEARKERRACTTATRSFPKMVVHSPNSIFQEVYDFKTLMYVSTHFFQYIAFGTLH